MALGLNGRLDQSTSAGWTKHVGGGCGDDLLAKLTLFLLINDQEPLIVFALTELINSLDRLPENGEIQSLGIVIFGSRVLFQTHVDALATDPTNVVEDAIRCRTELLVLENILRGVELSALLFPGIGSFTRVLNLISQARRLDLS